MIGSDHNRPVQRWALGVSYIGDRYAGWQKQPHVSTVQGCLETALSRVANHPITVYCAGRTDQGVHAVGQVVHFDTIADRGVSAWIQGAHTHLPPDLRISWAQPVAPGFHARFSAHARTYRYWIWNDPVLPPFYHQRMGWYPRPLDWALMQRVAHCWLGEHDFSSFRGPDCQSRTPIRWIEAADWYRHSAVWVFQITANAFLHHMVRKMVGLLVAVGSGKYTEADAHRFWQWARPNAFPEMAPGWGLYLYQVGYAPVWGIPMRGERHPMFAGGSVWPMG